jgi:hypothetical protein
MISGRWFARTDYGNPAPFVQFWADPGATASGEIRVAAASSSPFYFKSVDLYSSTTPIPYIVTGSRNGSVVFTIADAFPNTFGDFRTLSSPNSADAIDLLSIRLTNAAAACCANPMGLDTIVLTSTPTAPTPSPPPSPGPSVSTFSLSGRVSDSVTGLGIASATLSVPNGRGGAASTTTGASGDYNFAALEAPPSGVTRLIVVNATASHYGPQTKTIQVTSNQSDLKVSFQLVPADTVITFGGFSGSPCQGSSPNCPLSPYAESGFTVSAVSGNWTASTGYGNPAPFVEFFATGASGSGEIRIAAGGSTFSFTSVDLYSSTTTIPYQITGLRNAATVFAVSGTVPNTFGNFATVPNPNVTAVIDALSIVLTNPAAGIRWDSTTSL